MVTLYPELLTVSAVALMTIGYIPYVRNILLGKTKPHAFTWIVACIIDCIGLGAQLVSGGGVGAWVTAGGALASITIFTLALFYGERGITKGDWACLLTALAALLIWIGLSSPFWSVIVISGIELVAFVPTYRKSFHKPHEETAFAYFCSALKSGLSIAALSVHSIETTLYPAMIMLNATCFLVYVMARRYWVSRKS